jgi:hypothetical protein
VGKRGNLLKTKFTRNIGKVALFSIFFIGLSVFLNAKVLVTNAYDSTVVISGVTNGGHYNTSRVITFNKGTGVLDGVTQFYSGDSVESEGTHTLVITTFDIWPGFYQEYNTSVTFTLDYTNPIISGVTNNALYNTTKKTITFNEGKGVLDGELFSSGSQVTSEGTHTLVVTDLAGNSSTVTFTIDFPPIITGVENNAFYKTDRTITFNEGIATLNGVIFSSGSSVSSEGEHIIMVSDGQGGVSTVTFTIDKTAPIITGVENNGLYNSDKVISFNEGIGMLDGIVFTSGSTVSAHGLHRITVTDLAGNTSSLDFRIDKIPPIVSGVENNGFYKIVWSDSITFNEGTAVLDGRPFPYSYIFPCSEGTHILVVTDLAGNVTTVTFTIDTKAPIVTGVSNEYYNHDVTISFNEGTAKLNGVTFISGSTVSVERNYHQLIVTDNAGNTTKVDFVIDKTAPVITGVNNNSWYHDSVTITFQTIFGDTAKLDGVNFTSGTTVKTEGWHSLVATDLAGNVTTIAFAIDRYNPVITGVVDNNYYKDSKTITFDKGTGYLDGIVFASGSTVSTEGIHTIRVISLWGHISEVTFTIDKTPPTIKVTSYSTKPTQLPVTVSVTTDEGMLNATSYTFTENGSFVFIATDLAGNISEKTVTISHIDKIAPVISGVVSGVHYNISVKPTFNEGQAMLNGNPFASSTLIESEGNYELVVTDEAGNKSTVSFNIDKTVPVITVKPYSTELTYLPVTVSVTTNEGTLNKMSHTFTENGSFTFVATDMAGNITEKMVTITHIVPPSQAKSIDVSQLPVKLNYVQGVELNPTGGQLQVKTYDGSTQNIAIILDMLSGYDPNSLVYGPQTVIVTYQGLTTSFEVYLNRFIDVPYGHRNYTHINALVGLGIINGYSDNTFRPNNTLTRAQTAIMIVRAAGISTDEVSSNFTDVPPTHAAYKFISAAYQTGIINGYSDGTFRPNANVTRAQIAIMVQRAFNIQASGTIVSFTDVPEGYAPKKFIEILASQKIVNGYSDGTFKPLNNVTRAQFSTMIYNAIQYAQKTE